MDGAVLIKGLKKVTGKWCKQRKLEERQASARLNRRYAMTRYHDMSIKDAAWTVMARAYMKASSNGKLPAHARQIMYAARGEILRLTGRDRLDDKYFTQTILPGYINAHPDAREWDVVYDARGHFTEPHASKSEVVPLGTIDVRAYLAKKRRHTVGAPEARVIDGLVYPTCGPRNRFGAVLFIEKEGFLPLFERVRLADKYDLAIMSTKGVSNVASRQLVDDLCGGHNIPLLVLHDFDPDGFKILGSLQTSNERYRFANSFKVIDLGLRLEDVAANDLEVEDVHQSRNLDAMLVRNGATSTEIDFLHHQRVELNAFGSGEFIEWLESKLADCGIEKVVPDAETLAAAYRRSVEVGHLEQAIDRVSDEARSHAEEVVVPDDLDREVRRRLDDDPTLSWDAVVAEQVAELDD